MAVDLVVEEAGWDELPLAKLSEASVSAVIRSLKIDADGASVAILACDDARIAELNREFRAQPQATNVLAWPSRPHATRVAGTAHAIAPTSAGAWRYRDRLWNLQR